MATPSEQRKPGPVFDIALPVLAPTVGFRAFQAGGSRADFARFLDSIAPDLIAAGLPVEDVHFAKRYPRSPDAFVDDMLLDLNAQGILPGIEYDKDWYRTLTAGMNDNYRHGSFRTYIYPEEARLLFAAVNILRPKSAVFLGSYYGYWAHTALASIVRHGGRAVLVDPDPAAQAVARGNIERAGLSGRVEVAVTSGQQFADEVENSYDLVVLDAEGPRDHPDPEQRGKCIYAPLLRHILPRIAKNACLACHNILFQDIANCRYFDAVIERNHRELDPFMALASAEFPLFLECTSTEGVGFWRK
jgi:predicted O-methyltransferase YrrM